MTGTAAVPQTAEEFEELLGDTARIGAALQDGTFPGMVKDYAEKHAAKNEQMVTEFREQMQLGLQSFMQSPAAQGARMPEGFRPGMGLALAKGSGPRRARAMARAQSRFRNRNVEELFDAQGLFSARADGSGIDDAEYSDTLQRFVWATLKGEVVAAMNGDSAELDKLRALKGSLAKALEVRNAGLSERIPSEGGFLVPETLRSEIMALSLEESVVRPYATVIPMDSLRVPLPTIDDTSHTANVFGGVAAYWTAEGAALTTSSPKFSRLLLQANKLTAYTEIPNELLQDSASPMDVWFRTFFPQAVSFFEDSAYIRGDGADQPQGLMHAPGAVTVTGASGHHITYANTVTMFSRMWPASLKNAVWLAAPDAIPELAEMAVTANDGSSTTVAPPVFLPGMSALNAPGEYDGRSFTLMGRPGIVTEKAPALAGSDPGSLMFVDLTKYLIGDRQAMQIASSAEYKFANDMVAYRVILRGDGRFWVQAPITPVNGSSNTLSPLVLLDTTS